MSAWVIRAKRAMRARRKAAGQCTHCWSLAAPNRTKCTEHLEMFRSLNNDRNVRTMELCLKHYGPDCVGCGESERKFLTLDHINGGGKQERQTVSSPALRGKLVKLGFPVGFQTLCFNCNFKKHRGDGKPNKTRLIILKQYGTVCACCDTDDTTVLTIDHIDGGGRKHRDEVGSGHNFYEWLRRNDLPVGYQTLCFNCNSGRSVNGGICPHQAA